MTTKYFALLTNQGAARLANAAALGTKLQITQMAVGDGGGTLPTPDPAQTALTGEKRRAALNSLSIDTANSSQIIAEQIIPESEGGFWIREIGLFDADGVLIAVANCAETYKPLLAEGSGRTQTVRMILIVNSTSAVTLKIDPAVVLATRQYVDNAVIEVKAYADSLMAQHLAAADPHRQYAPIASPQLTGTPKAPTAAPGNNTTQLATTAFVTAALAALTGSAPEALDTLKELADALGDDPNFSATVLNALAGKMAIDQNGADIGDVAAFVKNLGLGTGLTGVVGQSRNALMHVATAGTTATWTADELIVQTASGGTQYKLSGLALPVDLSVIGAGGVDVAGSIPASGFMAVYAIWGPGKAPAALARNATSAKAPEICPGSAMPAGYTASALVSVWRVASGQFVAGWQCGRRISFVQQMALASSISAPSYTPQGIAAIVPLNALSVSGIGNPNISGYQYNTNMTIAASADGVGAVYIGCGGAAIVSPFSNLPLITPQTIYYTLAAGTALQTSYIYITGYEI